MFSHLLVALDSKQTFVNDFVYYFLKMFVVFVCCIKNNVIEILYFQYFSPLLQQCFKLFLFFLIC